MRGPDRPPRRVPPLIATAAALVALVIGALAWQLWGTDDDTAAPETTALPLPDKPSIAVLPFQDLSETPQQWFGDGMAEDIITDLSKLSGLFVIARNSSFQYRGSGQDLGKVGRELGVAYLLEGLFNILVHLFDIYIIIPSQIASLFNGNGKQQAGAN